MAKGTATAGKKDQGTGTDLSEDLGEPAKVSSEMVETFCQGQAEFRARLAQAGGRDDGPRNLALRDPGAHQGA